MTDADQKTNIEGVYAAGDDYIVLYQLSGSGDGDTKDRFHVRKSGGGDV